jgi:membrane-bound lytic murein transglycosylase D
MPPARILTIISLLFLGACSLSPSREPVRGVGNVSSARVAAAASADDAQDNARNVESDANYGDPEQAVATDVWQRIRSGLKLERHLEHPAVQEKIAWYVRNRDYLDRVTERATPYLYFIVERLEERDLPLDLALLPVVESAYQPFAYSPSRAAGIWQFIPGTGKRYGLKQNWWYDGRRDIVESTRAALDYLEILRDEFNGDWLHAVAAYNAGELNVARAIARNRASAKPADFWSLSLPRETTGYVPSLLAVAEIVAYPEKYGFSLAPIPNEPYFASVDTGGQLELAAAARLAGLPLEQMRVLNPGFSRWATDPEGPHRLLIPVAAAEQFRQRLAELPQSERVTYQQHRVRQGETLGQIAQRYRTSVDAIKTANRLKTNLIRVNQHLLIPASSGSGAPYAVASVNDAAETAPAADGGLLIHTVRAGDTLWNISRQYEISIARLCALNNIVQTAVLQPGQKLHVRQAAGTGGLVHAVAHNLPADGTVGESRLVRYTVREGDSLWAISQRFRVTVEELRAWNRLSGSTLRPGQQLELHVEAGI